MVESNLGDGVVRNTIYAKWRDDKPATPGYSRELVSVNLDPKFYDNMEQQPHKPGCRTFLDYFERLVAEHPNDDYLGTRVKVVNVDADGKQNISYGEY